MTTGLPRTSRPSLGPPGSGLPSLSMGKTRKSTGGLPTSPEKTVPGTPRSGLRAPSASGTTTLQPRAVSGINAGGKTLRKSVSINSFPQPPRSDVGRSSVPPSPLSSGAPGRKLKTPTTPNYTFGSTTPSLLNGTGEGKSVARPGQRSSDGLMSVASPTQSRSSSAQDSYSTSATQYDDEPGSKAGLGITNGESSMAASTNGNRMSKLDGKGNVIVSVRVRPDAGGQDNKAEGEWMVDGRKALVAFRGKEGGDYYYVYDHSAKRLVRRVMEGYHGTVFAYGMTGTGKTFSMQGTASSPGVIPLAITDIFSYIRETPSREFLLRVSYLEIYNEKIHDLLSMPTGGGAGGAGQQDEIKLREDSKRGVYASPLKEEIVQSPTQLLRVIARGDQARRTASTQFNARSSRSHAVVQIVVESRERIPGAAAGENKRGGMLPGGVRVSTLSLIDLAGSEKAAETKERRTEGSHINKSLLTLGTVIAKLSENKNNKDKDGKHLPYRDSKLTRLLQGALSGNSLVSILCTIQIGAAGSSATASNHTLETINTLKFASRAKNSIVSHAKRAEEALGGGGDGGARVLLERYRMEILELRSQLDTQAKGGKEKVEDEERVRDAEEELAREREAEHRHEEQMLEMQLARTALKERIDHLNRLILSSKSIGVNTGGTYSSLGIRSSVASVRSIATTNAGSGGGARSFIERTASMTSSSSTVGRRTSNQRLSAAAGGTAGSMGVDAPSTEDDDSLGEYGDGLASMAAQNQALQADLADKNRYIATLEKRLLQARRASSSRTSVGLGSGKGIMVGEDHSVSTVIREKDIEIAELRARLEDKDRMLDALRRAARSRENADRVDSRAEHRVDSRIESRLEARLDSRSEFRSSQLLEPPSSPPIMALPPTPGHPVGVKSPIIGSNLNNVMSASQPVSPVVAAGPTSGGGPKRSSAPGYPRASTKSVDEMSRMLDEMIQDRVESGQIVRNNRGSVRVVVPGVVPGGKPEDLVEGTARPLEPLRRTPSLGNETSPVALEA